MNATLAYMADEQATGEDAAIEFLTKHRDILDMHGLLLMLLRRSKQACRITCYCVDISPAGFCRQASFSSEKVACMEFFQRVPGTWAVAICVILRRLLILDFAASRAPTVRV